MCRCPLALRAWDSGTPRRALNPHHVSTQTPHKHPPKTALRNLQQSIDLHWIRRDLDCVHWCKIKHTAEANSFDCLLGHM